MTTGIVVERKRTAQPGNSLRLDPEARLCPLFDSTGIALYPVASRDRMGFRVLDDCCQEHIM